MSATCEGSIPLKDIPSTVASNVASSIRVEIADVTAFHSSGEFVLATNTNVIQLWGCRLTDFKIAVLLIESWTI